MDLELPGLDNMTDDEFFNFCLQNKNTQIERDQNHQIYIMPPAGSESSGLNLDLATEVNLWNRKSKLGKTREATAGYYLPDGSMLSPDVSWMSIAKWEAIPTVERQKFPYTTPEFVIELMSPSDRLKTAKSKMLRWIENGVMLGWLINPKTETTFIYRANGSVEIITGFDKKLSGEDVLPGFELDLSILK
ncbi:MAG: Uma2 family endonuclease [Bacteroidota bacterium]